MEIRKDSVVSIRYVMKNSSGQVLENTMESDPVNYLHGSAAILPGLQLQLEGLQRGAKKLVYLAAESGDFTFDVLVDDIRPASKQEVLLGYPVQINTTRCEADCDCHSLVNGAAHP